MRRILIALKDRGVAGKLSAMLSKEEFKVFVAGGHDEAMSLYAAERPELVLVELDLSPVGGDTFCINIRQMFPDGNSFIMLACGGTPAELRRCGRSGADAYVESPVNPEDVSRRISIILQKAQWRAPRVLVKVQVDGRKKSDEFFCTTRNISSTGILLETEKALARGDVIHCAFFLPDTERIKADCKIVRVTKTDDGSSAYGVEFISLDSDQEASIREFIFAQRESGNLV